MNDPSERKELFSPLHAMKKNVKPAPLITTHPKLKRNGRASKGWICLIEAMTLVKQNQQG
jgi:hypothetical protein